MIHGNGTFTVTIHINGSILFNFMVKYLDVLWILREINYASIFLVFKNLRGWLKNSSAEPHWSRPSLNESRLVGSTGSYQCFTKNMTNIDQWLITLWLRVLVLIMLIYVGSFLSVPSVIAFAASGRVPEKCQISSWRPGFMTSKCSLQC